MVEILTEYVAGDPVAHHIYQDTTDGPMVVVVTSAGEIVAIRDATDGDQALAGLVVETPQDRLAALIAEQERLAAELAALRAELLA